MMPDNSTLILSSVHHRGTRDKDVQQPPCLPFLGKGLIKQIGFSLGFLFIGIAPTHQSWALCLQGKTCSGPSVVSLIWTHAANPHGAAARLATCRVPRGRHSVHGNQWEPHSENGCKGHICGYRPS